MTALIHVMIEFWWLFALRQVRRIETIAQITDINGLVPCAMPVAMTLQKRSNTLLILIRQNRTGCINQRAAICDMPNRRIKDAVLQGHGLSELLWR